MATFEGTPLPSSFLSPNDLLQTQAFRYGPQTYADAHQNALLGQQEFGLREREFGLKQQEFDARRAYDDFGGVPGAATGPAAQGGGGVASGDIEQPAQQRAMAVRDGLVKRGMDMETATGFAANALHESSANPNTGAGDGGASHGLFQWNGPRRDAYVAKFGHSPDNAPLDEQLDFVMHELNGSESLAKGRIAQAKGVDGKAAQISEAYLRPKDTGPEMQRRSATALKLAGIWSQPTQTAAAAPAAPAPGAPVAPTAPGAPNPAELTAVSDAARTLLAMPEAQRAAAYGPVVAKLQAQGMARNAPAQYPGHDVIEKLAGGAAAPVTGPQTDQAWLDNQAVTYPALVGPQINQQAGTQPPVAPAVPAPYQIAGAPVGPPSAPAGPQRPAVPVNDLTPAPPAAVAPPAALAPPAAVAPAPPPPAAAPTAPAADALPPLNSRGLSAQQVEQLRRMRAAGQPTAAAEIAFTTHNDALKQQHFEQLRQAEKDAHTARVEAGTEAERTYQHGRNAVTDKAAADKAAMEAAQAAQPRHGNDLGAQHENDLITLAPKIADGTATDAEKRQYSLSYAGYQISGTPVAVADPTDPTGRRQVLARLPREVPSGMPAPPYPVSGDTGAKKPVEMTQDQSLAATYADRMHRAAGLMEPLDTTAITWAQNVKEKAGNFVGYNINSPDFQRLRQSQEDFILAVLRKESGAAIGQGEFDRYAKQYFPVPGDDAATIRQKQENRKITIAGMQREAGPGYKMPEPAAATGARPPLSSFEK